ncbi:RNA-binding protein [Sphaerotilaceae bacterium SBD11-9]
MTRMLLGNIEPGTTDDEIKEFLAKYGFPEWTSIEHVEGDGSRPAVLILYEGLDTFTLNELKPRIHEIFWKHRKLNVSVLIDHFR